MRAEAVAWLGTDEGVSAEGATLAELLAARGDLVAPHQAERVEPRLQRYLLGVRPGLSPGPTASPRAGSGCTARG